MKYDAEDPITPLHIHFQSEKRSEPHNETQSIVDRMEETIYDEEHLSQDYDDDWIYGGE